MPKTGATAAPDKITFRMERCKGCGLCVIHCPKKYLEIGQDLNQKGYLVAHHLDPEHCLACGLCALMCPDCVIEVRK